jgi:hypothetical protein
MLTRHIYIALIYCIFLGLTGCRKETKSPTMVLKELMNASAKAPDIGTLLPFMCKEDVAAYYDLTNTITQARDSTKSNFVNYNDILNKSIKKYATNIDKLTYLSENITGSKAIVVIQDSLANKPSTIHLIQEDGTWKVYADFKNKFKPLKEK